MAALYVVGMSGSIRERSFNSALLRAAAEMLPPDVIYTEARIDTLPFYNQDLEAGEVPPVVRHLRETIAAADGIMIATPEYNYSVSGMLKNAIEWASRPVGKAALPGKPAALLAASAGGFGGVRAQLALRQILAGTNNPVVNRPEILVPFAQNKFNNEGELTDEQTRTLLEQSIASFVTVLRERQAAADDQQVFARAAR